MSWSDDTRCLYCEGRLPLYRKITHGQFCSSAHRKAYWQEQERLAVERLHQTHSSLRSYRSATHPEIHQEVAPQPDLGPVTEAIAAGQLPAASLDLELEPAPSFDVDLYPIPDMGALPAPASELLSLLAPDFPGVSQSSPELITADPFEYESTMQPLPPSAAGAVATSPLPEGPPVAVWAYLALQPSSVSPRVSAASVEREAEIRYPRPQELGVEIQAAGRVKFPLSRLGEGRRTANISESALQILQMDPVPVTSIELKVPLESDVLIQLLDQQVPHPDRLHSLHQFAVHQPGWAPAVSSPREFDAAPLPALPSASTRVIFADYPLQSESDMLKLSGVVGAAHGTFGTRGSLSAIAANPKTQIPAAIPAVEPVPQMGLTGLLHLSANRVSPASKSSASVVNTLVVDFSAGVSSDVCYPRMIAVALSTEAPMFTRSLPLTFAKKRQAAGKTARLEPIARLLPESIETHPFIPNSGLEPLDRKPAEDALRAPQSIIGALMQLDGLKKLEPAWAHASGFWQHAPRDLKLLLFAIPALLALVFHPGWPRVAFAAPQPSTGLTGSFKRVLNSEWGNVRQTLENRAAVALDEDFRAGLDNWASPGGSTTEWSFDATGFVRPGPLALYRPSVNLTDYHVEFVGLIDKKAMSWVVRAADFDNFYVVKLVVLKSGPMPEIGLTRYAVIGGKGVDRHDVKIPLSAREDTVYNIRMDVQGSDFSVEVQGQMADSWTETRLPRGGIGFFTGGGEASRLRWMQITHQYDMLGRLCAYLAPYDTTNGSWQP